MYIPVNLSSRVVYSKECNESHQPCRAPRLCYVDRFGDHATRAGPVGERQETEKDGGMGVTATLGSDDLTIYYLDSFAVVYSLSS